jgi:pimeloyl-ACP methyl ester carboxylesterase
VPGAGDGGAVLLFHGNGGNIGDRVLHAQLLNAVGFDVLLAEYRGYGDSSGRPGEEGTYRDAAATLEALRGLTDPARIIYLGESLGAAVALWLALREPPRGLVLHTAFTSVRDVARLHYPMIPPALVPDAYPSLRLVRQLRAPVLVTHGDRDEIVPLMHGEELYAAAPEPKRLEIFERCGHNDLLLLAGERWAAAIADWAAGL